MNNNVKNDFWGFPKVKWLHLTSEVDKSVRFLCKIFSGFNIPKIIKIGHFDRVIQKIKRWTFWGHRVVSFLLGHVKIFSTA